MEFEQDVFMIIIYSKLLWMYKLLLRLKWNSVQTRNSGRNNTIGKKIE